MHPAWGRKEWTASGKFKCMCVIEVSRMGFIPSLYMRIQRDKLHWLQWQTVTREKAFYPHFWEAWLHFQFALYRFAAVGLHLGRWLLHAWKHKWGTGKENLSYLWEKKKCILSGSRACRKTWHWRVFPFLQNNEILGGNVRMGDLTLCSLIIPLCFRDKESGDMSKWFLWERDKLVCALTIKA